MAETSEGADQPWRGGLRPELGDLTAYVPHAPAGIRVKLDANEAPPIASPRVKATVADAVGRVALERYPDATAARLKAAIAHRTGARPEEIVCGTGSDDVISLMVNTLARPRRKNPQAVIIAPTPSFVMYRVTARAHGVKCVEVPLDAAWDLDMRAMARAVSMMEPNIVFVATPNNPTGNAMSEERVVELLNAAPSAVVVIDEAYADFSGRSLRALRAHHPNMAILRTVSKLGLAALRVGWLEADPGLIRELDKARQPFNVSGISQAAAAAVLEDAWDEVQEHVRSVVAERERLARALEAYPGVVVTPSDANFLWIKTGRPAEEAAAALAAKGVLVRSFHQAAGRLAQQLRVTVGTPSENDAFLEALAAAIAT